MFEGINVVNNEKTVIKILKVIKFAFSSLNFWIKVFSKYILETYFGVEKYSE